MTEQSKLDPLPDVHSQTYWDAASNGKLLIQRCGNCGAFQFYPREYCTRCFAYGPQWYEASGRGRLHTYSVVYRNANPEFAGDCPYVLAVIELEEGVRITSRVLTSDPGQLCCDLPVQAAWPESENVLPVFVPDPDGNSDELAGEQR